MLFAIVWRICLWLCLHNLTDCFLPSQRLKSVGFAHSLRCNRSEMKSINLYSFSVMLFQFVEYTKSLYRNIKYLFVRFKYIPIPSLLYESLQFQCRFLLRMCGSFDFMLYVRFVHKNSIFSSANIRFLCVVSFVLLLLFYYRS